MPDYYLAPSLVRLRARVNALWPNRDRASDGWIGNASHQATKSDHNPDWDAPGQREGIVRALDIDEDGIDSARLLRELVGHPAVEYVIYEGRIFSRVRDFSPRAYSGINAHEHHLHVSIRHTVYAEQWNGVWLPDPEDDMSAADVNTLKAAIDARADVTDRIVRELAAQVEQLKRRDDGGLLVRKVGTPQVYRAFAGPDGWVLAHVSRTQYAALGDPPVIDLPAGDPILGGRVLADQSKL